MPKPYVSDEFCMKTIIFRVVLQILALVHQVITSGGEYLRAGPIVDRTHNCVRSSVGSSMDEGDTMSSNNIINSVSPRNAMQDASMASPWQFPYSP